MVTGLQSNETSSVMEPHSNLCQLQAEIATIYIEIFMVNKFHKISKYEIENKNTVGVAYFYESMAGILKYKIDDCLSDDKGQLSRQMPSSSILAASKCRNSLPTVCAI